LANRKNKAIKGAITSVIQFLVLTVLQVFLIPVILKEAGQEVLGAYSIVMQIIGYGLILDFGLGVAISRYLAQNFTVDDKDNKFTNIFNVGRFFILSTNLLLSMFILVLAFNIDMLITGSDEIITEARTSLYILSIWALIKTPLVLYGYGLLASQNMATANIIGLISSIGRLGFSLYLVYAGYGLIGLIVANIVSEFFGLLLQKIYFNKLFPKLCLKWSWPAISKLKELCSFGLTYWGVNVANVLTVGSDSILIGHLYGAVAVAIFYTTKIPSFLVTQIIYKISDNSSPAINELIAKGNLDSVKTAYLKILRYSLLFALPLAIGIIGFNKGVIVFWVGVEQYAGAVMSFALAVFVFTQVVSHINAMIIVALGNMRNWMTISVLCGVLTIALAYVLGKFFGMQWVMVAISFMDIPLLIFLMRRALVVLDLSFAQVWRESIVPTLLAVLPLLLWIFFLMAIDQYINFISLIACISVFVIFWLIGAYILGITTNERKLIMDKLNFL
jgi:O-antigen/teichoic acid export membrane protein